MLQQTSTIDDLGLDPLEPIGAPQSHQALADGLRKRIAFGAYAPGDRLPAERDLAETLGVGRTTIREALRILAREGLLETRRGRHGGTFVADYTATRRLSGEASRRSREEVRETYEMRLLVEPGVARMAAERATPAQREQILRLATTPADSFGHYRTLDARLHLAIAASCGNRFALDAVQRSRADFFSWADAWWDTRYSPDMPSTSESIAQHVAIARAIADGDVEAAGERMRHHLERSATVYGDVVAGHHPDLDQRSG